MSNSNLESIGGYFELELPAYGRWLHDKSFLLNSGRSALELILEILKPSLLHIPKFTCDAIMEPIYRTGTAYRHYSITSKLEIEGAISLAEGQLLLYTNYFGIKDNYCADLSRLYGNQLILDFSHALFSLPLLNTHTFYSPRKFMGVPDGGCLYTNMKMPLALPSSTSLFKYEHLAGRLDLGAEDAYNYFLANEKTFENEGVKEMSPSTKRLLSSINYQEINEKRRKNFSILHDALGHLNTFDFGNSSVPGSFVYPLLCDMQGLRLFLQNNKVYTPIYWPNVLEWCAKSDLEWHLTKNLVSLPIDQRYGVYEMKKIIDLVTFYSSSTCVGRN